MSWKGRKTPPLWENFIRDTSITNNVKAICKSCKKTMQGVIGRLEQHVKMCIGQTAESQSDQVVEVVWVKYLKNSN